jgi:ATP-dependent RNA helicase DDX5/DBP2
MYFGGPLAVVLAPTRELAIQIYNASTYVALCSGVKMGLAYGGATKEGQLDSLNNGIDILIATPGRLIDFLNDGQVNLMQVSFFVLDEADRMLDMGFFPQVRRIVQFLCPSKQSLCLSATWPAEVESLSKEICQCSPVKIRVGVGSLTLNDAVSQKVMMVPDCDKRKSLLDLLKEVYEIKSKIIIFVKTKKGCDRLAKYLEFEGYKAFAIHGDKMQSQRDSILEDFKCSDRSVLVATDVASRGLDIREIKIVINYDFPQCIEDYIHRIGRTGRAGAKGKSFTFFNENDVICAKDLADVGKRLLRY